ncbi:O-antigen ligase family protein [Salinicoccus roseus]|uniref:O-antigen ligase family protein n=1 Tax=Salinicoccus roseus TaxID=45670 RepID=UPI001CA5F99A|nr:O-antigen ligase family protein [Salinicoccus roseus]MBY8908367.1 O-antigen ligase family protein [Salinicoccus roseus]
MNKIIPIFGIMSTNLFFTLTSIFGYEYLGEDDSYIYFFYIVIIGSLNYLLFFLYITKNNIKFNSKDIILILVPFFFFANFLISGFHQGFNPIAVTYFLYFLIWTVPVIYISIYIRKKEIFVELPKYFEVSMIVFTIAVFITTIGSYVQGQSFTSIGGATYQTASYIAALAYGLNLYFLLYGKYHKRFYFAKSRIYSVLSFVFLIVQFVAIFMTGGRGGIVLFSIFSIYIIGSVLLKSSLKLYSKLFAIILMFLIFIPILFQNLMSNNQFLVKFNRTLEFLSFESGLNWEGSSNRDILYLKAINLIMDQPLLGYGIYGFWDVSGYPHNLVLEILLNGGLLYFVFVLLLLLYVIIKLVLMIKREPQYRLLAVLLIYPLTMLMFSGSYMIITELWFVLSFVYGYHKVKVL